MDLGKDEPAGVLRACAMTLIVVVEEERDAQAIGETIAALMHEHPSRAIVLRVRSGNEPSLSARVFAQCWMPFGSRQQICCEQVEIISSLASFSDVTSVLRGLIVSDLPVVLYCPSETLWPLPELPLYYHWLRNRIIDSFAVRTRLPLSRISTAWRSAVLRKADLSVWRSLHRESIAQHLRRSGSGFDRCKISTRFRFSITRHMVSLRLCTTWPAGS